MSDRFADFLDWVAESIGVFALGVIIGLLLAWFVVQFHR